MKKYFYLLLAMLVFSSCHLLSPYHVWIDNPSDSCFIILLHNNSYKIEGKASLEIFLAKGNYNIKVMKDSANALPLIDETITIHEDGIINICKAEYMFVQQVYSTHPVITTPIPNQNNEVAMQNYTYNGTIQKIGKDLVFIPKIWDKGLNDELCTFEKIYGREKVISKIFRCNEFETDFLRNAGR